LNLIPQKAADFHGRKSDKGGAHVKVKVFFRYCQLHTR